MRPTAFRSDWKMPRKGGVFESFDASALEFEFINDNSMPSSSVSDWTTGVIVYDCNGECGTLSKRSYEGSGAPLLVTVVDRFDMECWFLGLNDHPAMLRYASLRSQ